MAEYDLNPILGVAENKYILRGSTKVHFYIERILRGKNGMVHE